MARLGLLTALLLAAAASSARTETRTSDEPAATKPAQVVAIIPTKPARLTVLDARTLRPTHGGWSLKLASRSADQPAVLSPAGSRVAVVRGGDANGSALIVDSTTGHVLRRVAEISGENVYWLRGDGGRTASPAVVVQATFACSSGGIPTGVCGDELDVMWTSDRRLDRGGEMVYAGFLVEAVLRASLVLAESATPRDLVVWRWTATTATAPADEPAAEEILLSKLPETSTYAIAADARNDRLFVVTGTGLVAAIRRSSTREPLVEYHSVSLNGERFSAAWAGSGRIALWGKDGLGTIDIRTWTTHHVADGVTGALPTRFGIAAWTNGPDGVSVYRPDGSRRLHVLKGTRVAAARAVGTYLYADTDANTRYSVDLRTGRTVGPLGTRAWIIRPSFTLIP